MVIIFANPNFAPGANANGNGIERSNKVMTTPCAANNEIYINRVFFFISVFNTFAYQSFASLV